MVADLRVVDPLPFPVGPAVDAAGGRVAEGLGDAGDGALQAGVHLARWAGLQVAALEAGVLHVSTLLVVGQAVLARLLRARADARAVRLAVVALHGCRVIIIISITSSASSSPSTPY